MFIIRLLLLSSLLLTSSSHAEPVTTNPAVPVKAERLRSLVLSDINYQRFDLTRRLPQDHRDALAASIRELEADVTFKGMSVAVLIPGEGTWTWSTGTADQSTIQQMQTDHRMHAGSIGKVATANLIWQLIEQQQLYLEQPIGGFFPDWPAVSDITVEQLLNHTSGIYSFSQSTVVNERSAPPTPEDLIGIAATEPLLFAPGSHWSYSNTNYVMLGLIVEQLTEFDYREQLQVLINSLRLEQTVVLYPGSAKNHLIPSYINDRKFTKDYAVPHGAGALATTPTDLVHWFYQLVSGQLIQPDSLQKMLDTLYPMSDKGDLYYGLGIMVVENPLGSWIYHGGRVGGFETMVAYSPSQEALVAVMSNSGDPVTAMGYRLFKIIKQVRQERTPLESPVTESVEPLLWERVR